MTAEPYVAGAPRLTPEAARRNRTDDILHANAVYGAAVLDQIATRLAG